MGRSRKKTCKENGFFWDISVDCLKRIKAIFKKKYSKNVLSVVIFERGRFFRRGKTLQNI